MSEVAQTPGASSAAPSQSIYVLALLCIAYVISNLDRSLLSLLAPQIKADLNLSDTQFSLLQGFAFVVLYALAALPLANLADRTTRTGVIAGGFGLWSLATASCGAAGSFGALMAARMAVGIGDATLMAPAFSLLSDLFSKERLGKALAVFNMGGAIGAGAGLAICGVLIETLNRSNGLALPVVGHLRPWQSAFVLVAAPGIIMALLFALTVREPKRREWRAPTFERGGLIAALRAGPKTYALLFCAYPLGALVFSGWIAWSPVFLMRHYLATPGEAAAVLGIAFAVFGSAGVLFAGAFNDHCFRRGATDAPVLLSIGSAASLALIGSIAPFIPNIIAFGVMMCLFVFVGSCLNIVPAVAIQMLTPNRQRAQVTALFLLVVGVLGAGAGPTCVALLTDHVFRSEAALGSSLATTAAIFSTLMALLLWIGIDVFRRSLASAAGG